MLKRLTTIALVFGLICMVCGSAFADRLGADRQARPVGTNLHDTDVKTFPFGSQILAKALPKYYDGQRDEALVLNVPVPNAPDLEECFFGTWVDFDNWGANEINYLFEGGDVTRVGARWDLGTYDFAQIYGGYVYILDFDFADPSQVVDFVVEVWDDAGGLPGAMVHSEVFQFDTSFGGGYYAIYFAAPVEFHGDAFYLAVGMDVSEPVGNNIVLLTDDAGMDPTHPANVTGTAGTATVTGRAVWFDGTDWISLYDAEGGLADPNVLLYADYCEDFSECRTLAPYAGGSNVPLLPSRTSEVCGTTPWVDGSNLVAVGQRFSFVNDTLKSVTLRHYDLSGIWWGPLEYYDSTSTNGFLVEVWNDDGTGNVDTTGGPLAAETVPGGLDNIFPSGANQGAGDVVQNIVVDFSAHNLILRGAYHFTLAMTDTSSAAGQVAYRVSSAGNDPSDFPGGSVLFQDPDTPWERTGASFNWGPDGTGGCPLIESSFDIRPEVCLDEFAECQNQILYAADPYWVWTMCQGCTSLKWAHRVRGLPLNRVEKIRVLLADETLWGDPPEANGNPLVKINVYADDFGFPGAVIWDTVVTPVFFPGWTEVVIPGGLQTLSDFYVGYEGVFPDTLNDYFYAFTDDDAGAPVNGGAFRYNFFEDRWQDLDVELSYPDNLMAEVEFCSIPVDEIPCDNPGDDWTTVNHDYARTGRSGDEIGDAWCDLNFTWSFSHPTYAAIFNGPIIWNDMVVMAFSTGTVGAYYILDLMTGAVLDSITTTDYTAAILGSLRCQPTIDMVEIEVATDSFETRPLLFVGGGVANAVSAYDMSTVGGPINQVWEMTPGNGWLGHTGFMGSVRYPAFIVIDGVVYWGDDAGQVFAADAATGYPYLGWDPGTGYAPATLIGNVLRSGTTDGTQLFYAAFAAGVEGDVYAINAATGAVNWTLATGPDGLQASVLYGVDYVPNSENFQSGILFDQLNAKIWVNSTSTSANINITEEAIMYGISTTSGGVLHTELSQRSAQWSPILDARRIYQGTNYTWGTDGGIKGGSMMSFNRASGVADWASSPPGDASATWTRWFNVEGVLSCEPNRADILIGFSGGTNSNLAYLSFFDAGNGEEYFHRRIDYGAGNNLGGSGAMGMDSNGDVHVIFADFSGTITDLTKGDDRPRLEIMDWHPQQAVPFGTGDTVITFPAVYTNTGCADLSVTMVADDAANGTTPGGAPGLVSVRSSFAAFGAGLANSMADNYWMRKATSAHGARDNLEPDVDGFVESLSRNQVNPAAMAVPGYLIENGTYPGDVFSQTPYPGDAGGGGFVLGGFDTADVNVHVHGALVNRGRQPFFVEFQHDDPDYFLNDTGLAPTRWPDAEFALIGGCLIEQTYLTFGPGEHNLQIVFNTGRMGSSNGHDNLDGNFYIDEYGEGSIEGNYASMLMYAALDDSLVQGAGEEGDLVSSRRVALHNQEWYTGSTEQQAWISMQPDPNWIDSTCTPFEFSGTIAEVWTGAAYEDLTGNMIATQYIDSVQNFTLQGVWDWRFNANQANAPFDNDLTMGLEAKVMHVGAVDAEVLGVAPLNYGNLYLLEMYERSGGTVEGWKMGAFYDHDIVVASPDGGWDTVGIDRSVSAAWVYDGGDAGATYQYAQVKIPFGCGYEPIKNVLPMERQQSALAGNATQAWDSTYFYFTQDTGIPWGHTQETADDQDAYYTYIEHEFAPYDTIQWALAVGGFDGISDLTSADEAIAPFAHLMNKMAGFGRGDVDNDNVISFADIVYLAEYVNNGGPGPAPFKHLGDVDASGGDAVQADVIYLYDYYFNYGPCPMGTFVLSMDPNDYQDLVP